MDEFLSLTEIGRIYAVSSHVAGRWLKGLGLRDEFGKPTAEAFKDGFVGQAPSRQPGTFFYVWHRSKTTALLDGMCYPRSILDSDEQQPRSADS